MMTRPAMTRPPCSFLPATVLALVVSTSCARTTSSASGDHVHPDEPRAATTAATQGTALPAGATDAVQRLASSPRHAEWVMVRTGNDSVHAWVVYPEQRERAPV